MSSEGIPHWKVPVAFGDMCSNDLVENSNLFTFALFFKTVVLRWEKRNEG